MLTSRRWTAAALVVAVTLVMAASATAQAPRVKLKIAFPSVADLEDVPALLTAERLRPLGIDLEPTFFAQEVLAIQSVLRGDIDIGTGASRGTLAAIQEGANVKFFATQGRNPWTLYARREINTCADIAGKRFAIHSEAGISTAFVRGWLKEKCPTLQINFLIIPGSENRAAALMAGQIDITPLELPDAIQVDALRPGQFHRVADFAKDLPWLLGSIYYSTPKTLASKREVIKTFTRELLKVHRLAAKDPNVIAQVAPKYIRLFDVALLPRITEAFGANGYWPTDGGLTPEVLQRTIQFFVDIQSIKPGLRAEAISDFSILREVLAEIGR